ncbi:MAG: hypothetical protein V4466_14210 [Pseudomonadota bacterium]
MIEALMAAAAVAAAPASQVAPCIWGKLPAYKEQVIAAPDIDSFQRMRRTYPDGAAEAAFAACVPEGEGDAAAEMAFSYYEASLWARGRLAGKWPAEALAAIDGIPEQELKYFWLQSTVDTTNVGFRQAQTQAWARVYGPFGRTGPIAGRDDLDAYIVGRVGWRLGELDYREGLKRR